MKESNLCPPPQTPRPESRRRYRCSRRLRNLVAAAADAAAGASSPPPSPAAASAGAGAAAAAAARVSFGVF